MRGSGPPVCPRRRLFELQRERQQQPVCACLTGEVDPDRQALFRPADRHRHRRDARHVVDRRVARQPLGPPEQQVRVEDGGQGPYRRRQIGDGGADGDVEAGGPAVIRSGGAVDRGQRRPECARPSGEEPLGERAGERLRAAGGPGRRARPVPGLRAGGPYKSASVLPSRPSSELRVRPSAAIACSSASAEAIRASASARTVAGSRSPARSAAAVAVASRIMVTSSGADRRARAVDSSRSRETRDGASPRHRCSAGARRGRGRCCRRPPGAAG